MINTSGHCVSLGSIRWPANVIMPVFASAHTLDEVIGIGQVRGIPGR